MKNQEFYKNIVIADAGGIAACAKLLESDGYNKNHSARERGYVKSGLGKLLPYKGRFGEGYKMVIPNNLSSRKSNNYHDIIYFTKR